MKLKQTNKLYFGNGVFARATLGHSSARFATVFTKHSMEKDDDDDNTVDATLRCHTLDSALVSNGW